MTIGGSTCCAVLLTIGGSTRVGAFLQHLDRSSTPNTKQRPANLIHAFTKPLLNLVSSFPSSMRPPPTARPRASTSKSAYGHFRPPNTPQLHHTTVTRTPTSEYLEGDILSVFLFSLSNFYLRSLYIHKFWSYLPNRRHSFTSGSNMSIRRSTCASS